MKVEWLPKKLSVVDLLWLRAVDCPARMTITHSLWQLLAFEQDFVSGNQIYVGLSSRLQLKKEDTNI